MRVERVLIAKMHPPPAILPVYVLGEHAEAGFVCIRGDPFLLFAKHVFKKTTSNLKGFS